MTEESNDREKRHKVAVINGNYRGAALAAMAMSVLGGAFATSIVEQPRVDTRRPEDEVETFETSAERLSRENSAKLISAGERMAKAAAKRKRKAENLRRGAKA